jgi:hypothetical protein
MPFFPLLQPDLILGGSVLKLTPELLDANQIKGLVLDVDDTIVPISTDLVYPEVVGWIEQIRAKFPLWLVTNNPKEYRIGKIAESLSLPYFLGAGKPSRRKLRLAVEAMKLPPTQVAMVGDRVFTDVLAGNRLGMFTILIDPILSSHSTRSFHLLRQAEFSLARQLGVSLDPRNET